VKQILLLHLLINDRCFNIFKGIGASAAMDEKENGIDLKEMDVILENPTLDLKAIRKSRGLILKDMSSSTKVSLSNLKAIEEQKFELLPDPIYARAFIRAYARALDIGGEEALSLYDKYLESLEPDKNRNKITRREKASHEILDLADDCIMCDSNHRIFLPPSMEFR